MRHVLYVSELAEPHVIREACLPEEGDFLPPVFAALGVRLTVVDATQGAPPDPRGFDGVVVGGSFGSANDAEPWRVRLFAWLQALPPMPFFGICGGHQLLAVARGGRVVPMTGRRQVGLYPLALSGVEGWRGTVFQMHGDAVVEVPEGAEVWARDAWCVQALRYPGHQWTVQFHPEFPVDTARVAAEHCAEPRENWTEAGLEAAVVGGKALLRAWVRGGWPRGRPLG